jgi:ribonuclease HI
MKRKRDISSGSKSGSKSSASDLYAVAVGPIVGVYASAASAKAACVGCVDGLVAGPFEDVEAAEVFCKPFRREGNVVVYTDGACSRNGKAGARAGVGVYWGEGDARNISRRVNGFDTVNVAELEAVLDALKLLPADTTPATVVVDSKYVIDCQMWLAGWKRNGWKTACGKPVANQELIAAIAGELQRRPYVCFRHVLAHHVTDGNKAADRLAAKGALL